MASWIEATISAIRRHVARTGSETFTRRAFFAAELPTILLETRAGGLTPSQTLGRVLQEIRDDGLLAFAERGTYRWLGDLPEPEYVLPGKGVFVTAPAPAADERSDLQFRFERRWLAAARRTVGEWVIYQDEPRADGRGYYAVARVERIDGYTKEAGKFVARISRGTFLEFGSDVPLERDGSALERGLGGPSVGIDRERASETVRVISDDDFNRIVDCGLADPDEPLPRDDDEERDLSPLLAEEKAVWEGPIDRSMRLVSRKVRDRQFRSRVLAVYGTRCAFTGFGLINGGGRAEVEAAHIMSVEEGGPDMVCNGLALSGTVHWMFDRGLLSLSDAGDILLSRAINDTASVERLIFPDRKARLPLVAAHRPHPRFLAWHRSVCFKG